LTARQSILERPSDLTGIGLVVASALCYSLLSIFGKVALALRLPILPLLASRFTLGALILWMWVLAVGEYRRAASRLPRRRVAGLLAWGAIGFSGQSALFFLALQRIPASLTEVLLYTCPAFLALMLWGITRRRPKGSRLLAIGLALLGTWLCAGPIDGATDTRGVVLATLSGFWYAAFLIWMHRLTPGIPGAVSGAYIVTASALTFGAVSVLRGEGLLVPHGAAAWGALLGMVLSATVFGFVLFVVGLKRVGPQAASVLSTFEPLATLLLAAIFLGERLNGTQWCGAALIIGAAFVLASTSERDDLIGPADAPVPVIPETASESPGAST
jgi:drug/metabolite transporter (DMT)-like permease